MGGIPEDFLNFAFFNFESQVRKFANSKLDDSYVGPARREQRTKNLQLKPHRRPHNFFGLKPSHDS